MSLDERLIQSHKDEKDVNTCAGFLKTVVVPGVGPVRKDDDLFDKIVTGPYLKAIVRGDFDYVISRLTNVFLPKGERRSKLAQLFAFIKTLDG